MSHLKAIFFLFFAFTTLSLQAEEIVGDYAISGLNPYSNKPYTGNATITKKGKIYTAKWKDAEGNAYSATGLVQGDVAAFVFESDNESEDAEDEAPGLLFYKIGSGELKGEWVLSDGDRIGTETLKKK